MRKKGFNQKAFFSFLFILVLSLLSGCGGKKAKGLKTVEGDPEVLYKQGVALFNKKAYKGSLEKFEQLKSNFPDSPPFTVWAELKVADGHFYSKSYMEAVAAYEEFRKVHPTYEEMPYIQYQIGMCYFNQMTTADRDQTFTQRAMSSFEYLIANYPVNLFTEKAKEKIGDCQRQLAGHEFFIGDFYYRRGKFQSAAGRFEGLLEKYPKWLDQDKTLFFLGKSYIELDQREKAGETFARLIREYPKSPLAKEAKKVLAKDLAENSVASRKARVAPKRGKSEIPESEPGGLVLVKFEEEGKRAVPLTEERATYSERRDERVSVLPVSVEEARPVLPPVPSPPSSSSSSTISGEATKPALSGDDTGGDTRKVERVASPSPEEEKIRPIPSGLSEKSSEELKTAPILGEESAKSLPPTGVESKTENRSEEVTVTPILGEESAKSLPPTGVESKTENRSEERGPNAVLPGILGQPMGGEKPEGGTAIGSLQEARLGDTTRPIDITSDSVETLTKENLILFKGNVMARQKDIVIYADSVQAVVIDSGKGIERVIAGGNVKIQQGLRVANCERAIFYNLEKKVVLTGDPRVWEGDNSVSGEEIVFDIEQNRVEVKGGATGRGKVRIYPKEATEKKE